MAKKLKVWLNNKLNKRLRCTVVIKFYPIFITELVLTFLVFKYPNYFEFPKCGKWSPHLKILEIPGGRGGHQRPPGMENPGGWGGANQRVFCGGGGYGYFLEPHIIKDLSKKEIHTSQTIKFEDTTVQPKARRLWSVRIPPNNFSSNYAHLRFDLERLNKSQSLQSPVLWPI